MPCKRANQSDNYDSDPDWEDDSKSNTRKGQSSPSRKLTAASAPRGRAVEPAKLTEIDDGSEKDEHKFETTLQSQVEKAEKALFFTTKNAYDKVIKTLIKRTKDLKNKVNTQKKRIEAIKAQSIKQTENLGFDCEPDDSVYNNLKQKWMDVKYWVKKHGDAQAACKLDVSIREEVIKSLTDKHHPSTSAKNLKLAFEQNVSATTVLNSLLAKTIVDNFVREPFFFLKLDPNGVPTDLHTAILRLHALGSESIPAKANVWLSQTMAMLQSVKPDGSSKNAKTQSEVEAMKQEAYSDCATKFISSSIVQSLLKSSNESEIKARDQELHEIMTDFGEYFIKLGRQKVRMQAMSYNELESITFERNHGAVRQHSSHCLEDDDDSLDGESILLVVEPGINACGNESGEDYHLRKVWCPATVIVRDDRISTKFTMPTITGNNSVELPSTADVDLDSDSDMVSHMGKRRSCGDASIGSASNHCKHPTVQGCTGDSVSNEQTQARKTCHLAGLEHKVVTVPEVDNLKVHPKIIPPRRPEDGSSTNCLMGRIPESHHGSAILQTNKNVPSHNEKSFQSHMNGEPRLLTIQDHRKRAQEDVENGSTFKKQKTDSSNDRSSPVCPAQTNGSVLDGNRPRSANEHTRAVKDTDKMSVKESKEKENKAEKASEPQTQERPAKTDTRFLGVNIPQNNLVPRTAAIKANEGIMRINLEEDNTALAK